jgi:hypothetical protein
MVMDKNELLAALGELGVKVENGRVKKSDLRQALATLKDGKLLCDGKKDCQAPVTHIDNKGFVYCEPHGKWRKSTGTPCRKLTGPELKELEAGKPLKKY